MSNYLVTGAAGFIGSRVVDLLLAEGHSILGIDNLNDAYDIRLKHWRLNRLLGRENFTFQPIDICDRPALEEAVRDRQLDAVINLAARAGVRYSVQDPWIFLQTNATGVLNLLEMCRQKGIPKFILASTSSLYGTHNPMPFSEDGDTNQPLSPYAASKKAAEVMCYTYHYLYNLDVTVYRYFTVYGPAGRPDMSLFRFSQWIAEGRPLRLFGDGSFSRDFTFVDDIARGTIAGLKPVGYEVINLGNDQPHTMMEVIQLLEKGLGRKAEIQYLPVQSADMPATWANIAKARKLLGWQPQVNLEAGLAAMVDWYQRERSWASQVLTP